MARRAGFAILGALLFAVIVRASFSTSVAAVGSGIAPETQVPSETAAAEPVDAVDPVDAPSTRGRVVVGSKNFTENRLLGEMMAQLLEAHTDLDVRRRVNLGGTTIVFTALQAGEIDVYAEYTGTGWAVHLGREDTVNDALRAFLHVQREFDRRFDVAWLAPFGFENAYALAMDEGRARELGVRSISDLVEHQAELRAGVGHEFLNRKDGFPGLAEAYGLRIGDVRGMEHGLVYEAIRTGRVDLIDTYTTDGKLLRYDVRLLDDDRRFFPPYDCAPIARKDTLARHPEVRRAIERLAFRIDDARMRRLNARVEEEGAAFERVATDFLREEGLIEPPGGSGGGDDGGGGGGGSGPGRGTGSGSDSGVGSVRPGFFAFFFARWDETLGLVLEHLGLTVIAVGLATLIAVPLGVALTRRPALAQPVLGTAGLIQTIPSLALLAFMIPVPGLGLGARSAVAALFLYALLPIVRNAYTGVREVDADLIEAARGMGLSDGQILRSVELPLAVRTIMAGVRTSAVISIGVATLAAFIGAGGLGDPILTGLQLNDVNLILSGAVPAALLALLADLGLGRLERILAPKGLD